MRLAWNLQRDRGGRPGSREAMRTGHRSSAMINRYRRAARTPKSSGSATATPLDSALSDLRPARGVSPGVSQKASEAVKTWRPQRDSKPYTPALWS